MQREGNYDFLKRLLTVYKANRRDPSLLPEADEFVFSDTVQVVFPQDADEMLLTSAKDFADYLFTSMGVEAFISRDPKKIDQVDEEIRMLRGLL